MDSLESSLKTWAIKREQQQLELEKLRIQQQMNEQMVTSYLLLIVVVVVVILFFFLLLLLIPLHHHLLLPPLLQQIKAKERERADRIREQELALQR